jgi:hypothetical protein
MKALDIDRWPAGRPAAPQSSFFWADGETPAYVASMERYERSRRAASKAEATKRRNGTTKASIYGLSRGSDERVREQVAKRRAG